MVSFQHYLLGSATVPCCICESSAGQLSVLRSVELLRSLPRGIIVSIVDNSSLSLRGITSSSLPNCICVSEHVSNSDKTTVLWHLQQRADSTLSVWCHIALVLKEDTTLFTGHGIEVTTKGRTSLVCSLSLNA